MGGGSSKQEQNEDNNIPIPQPKKQSNKNSKFPSPRPDYRSSLVKENNKLGNMAYANEAEMTNSRIQNRSQNSQNIGVESLGKANLQYFAGWPTMFHKKGKLILRIFILVIEPTFQIKNLKKKVSEHQAELSWEYEYIKVGNREYTYLRFILFEEGGFTLRFLIDEEANCKEGDQAIWGIICPLRLTEQSQKVGAYICQRSYQSSQNQYDENGQDHRLQQELFRKWDQKPVVSRASMKKLLNRKRIIEDLKNQKGFEYSETTRYFSPTGEWSFSVLIQERYNSFKSWLIELTPQGDKKQLDKTTAMSSTLKNDIQTRESLYIEEMKKKRDIMQQSKQK